jgi:quinol monooxygenase YgiN
MPELAPVMKTVFATGLATLPRRRGVMCEASTVPLIALADLFGINGRRADLVALLERSEQDAAAQPGCRRYMFAATVADPDRFVLVSEWETQEALDAHYRSDGFATFQLGLDGLLARPSEMTVYAAGESVRPVGTRPMDPRDAD